MRFLSNLAIKNTLTFHDRRAASSDKVIRCWRTDAKASGRCLQTLSGHSDYVQCVHTTTNGALLASAGLMSEVFLWDLNALKPILNLSASTSPEPSPAVRAALLALEDRKLRPAWRPALPTGQQDGASLLLKGSVYAMAIEPASAQLVACGATDGLIRIYDPRSQENQLVCKLRGHTDNVRCLLLDEQAQLLLSASSDRTIRLWDLGQQRCVQTYRGMHDDAIWSLAVDARTGTIYSGGRDKSVRRTNMHTKAWDVLCETEQPVRSLALSADGGLLWVGTTNAHLAAYDTAAAEGTARERTSSGALGLVTSPMRRPSATQSPGNIPGLSLGEGALARMSGAGANPLWSPPNRGPSPLTTRAWGGGAPAGAPPAHDASTAVAAASLGTSLSARMGPVLPGQAPKPLAEGPKVFVRGQAPLVQATVLENRQHVLCRDMEGYVTLWDVTVGAVVQDFGQADFARTLDSLFRPEAVSSWFQADTRLGTLALRLDPCTCFSAEVYAADLGYSNVADDKKVNYGDKMVAALFRIWKGRFLSKIRAGDPAAPVPPPGLEPPADDAMDDDDPDLDAPRVGPPFYAASALTDAPSPMPASPGSVSSSMGAGSGSTASMRTPPPPERPAAPFRYGQLPSAPVILCETDDGRPWRCPLGSFDGTEPLGEVIPLWVYNAVVRGEFPTALMAKYALQNQNKLTFELQPAEGSNLPELQQASLAAPKILKVSKVINYTASKLAELLVPVSTGPSPDLVIAGVDGDRTLPGGPAGAPPKKLPFDALQAGDAAAPGVLPTLELLCHGQAVPYCLTLAAVRKYLCRGGEVLFHYRIKSGGGTVTAPLPKFAPPQQ